MSDSNGEMRELRAEMERMKNELLLQKRELTILRIKTPMTIAMLNFIREEGMVDSIRMVSKFGVSFSGAGRMRLYDAVRNTDGFHLIVGANRYMPSFMFYDDGSKRKLPQIWLFHLYKGTKPKQQIFKKTVVDWVAKQADGDLDYGKQIAETIFSPKSGIREQFKPLFEWERAVPCTSFRRR